MITDETHYLALAAAYARGALGPEPIAEAMRVASVAVIASVPSHEDNNPDHVHLFDAWGLEQLFRDAGRCTPRLARSRPRTCDRSGDPMIEAIFKYPRTQHLEGSRLQPGDHDLEQVPLDSLRGAYCVIEEKLDGANAGMSLDEHGRLRLQSRGHVLTGGPRERHFDLYKQWARTHEAALAERLVGGLTLYGEWLYAKHTIFYDQLPHYFVEFDIRDASGAFWSTAKRAEHLAGAPITAVPVVWRGILDQPNQLPDLVAHSLYKSPRWRERLRDAAIEGGVEPDRCAVETDSSDFAEGLYIKVEDPKTGLVLARYKWVRASFLTAVTDSGSHWHSRPIIANGLADGVDLFT